MVVYCNICCKHISHKFGACALGIPDIFYSFLDLKPYIVDAQIYSFINFVSSTYCGLIHGVTFPVKEGFSLPF